MAYLVADVDAVEQSVPWAQAAARYLLELCRTYRIKVRLDEVVDGLVSGMCCARIMDDIRHEAGHYGEVAHRLECEGLVGTVETLRIIPVSV